jgi:hypothetical protein
VEWMQRQIPLATTHHDVLKLVDEDSFCGLEGTPSFGAKPIAAQPPGCWERASLLLWELVADVTRNLVATRDFIPSRRISPRPTSG